MPEKKDWEKERETFFKELEEKIGEPIVQYVLAECQEGLSRKSVWGILCVCDSILYFLYSEGDGMLAKLFSMGAFSRKNKDTPEFRLSWGQIKKIEDLSPKSWFGKIFSPPTIPMKMTYISSAGDKVVLLFQIENKHRDFYDLCVSKLSVVS